jgi:hypothetical protein
LLNNLIKKEIVKMVENRSSCDCGCIPLNDEKKEHCECGCVPLKVAEDKDACGCGCTIIKKEAQPDK